MSHAQWAGGRPDSCLCQSVCSRAGCAQRTCRQRRGRRWPGEGRRTAAAAPAPVRADETAVGGGARLWTLALAPRSLRGSARSLLCGSDWAGLSHTRHVWGKRGKSFMRVLRRAPSCSWRRTLRWPTHPAPACPPACAEPARQQQRGRDRRERGGRSPRVSGPAGKAPCASSGGIERLQGAVACRVLTRLRGLRPWGLVWFRASHLVLRRQAPPQCPACPSSLVLAAHLVLCRQVGQVAARRQRLLERRRRGHKGGQRDGLAHVGQARQRQEVLRGVGGASHAHHSAARGARARQQTSELVGPLHAGCTQAAHRAAHAAPSACEPRLPAATPPQRRQARPRTHPPVGRRA